MKTAIIIFILLSLISGCFLIAEALKNISFSYNIIFFLIGIGAIAAALKYTMGKKPYGYSGFGDLFVFLFFGIVGVMGVFFLYTHHFRLPELLPTISMGCFSAGVLNLNNLRDQKNDKAFGKHTLIVKIGTKKGKLYHALLLSVGMLTSIIYSLIYFQFSIFQWIYLLAFVSIIAGIQRVFKNKTLELLDPELKKLSLSTLAYVILFGIGLLV